MIARLVRLPPVLFLACLAAGSVAQRLFPRRLGIPSFRVAMSIGVALLGIALLVGVSALVQFRRHRTPVEPGHRPTALITTGVFAFTRNPLYVCLLLVLTAIAIMTDALWIAAAVPVLWLLLDRLVIRWEENVIAEAFGEQYAAYRQRVRRWL